MRKPRRGFEEAGVTRDGSPFSAPWRGSCCSRFRTPALKAGRGALLGPDDSARAARFPLGPGHCSKVRSAPPPDHRLCESPAVAALCALPPTASGTLILLASTACRHTFIHPIPPPPCTSYSCKSSVRAQSFVTFGCARSGLVAGPTRSWSREVNFESTDARSEFKGNPATLDTTLVCVCPPGRLPCLMRASFGCCVPLSRPLPCDSLAASLPIACAARGLPLRRSASRLACSQTRASRPPSRPRDGSAAAPSGLTMEGRPAVVGHRWPTAACPCVAGCGLSTTCAAMALHGSAACSRSPGAAGGACAACAARWTMRVAT